MSIKINSADSFLKEKSITSKIFSTLLWVRAQYVLWIIILSSFSMPVLAVPLVVEDDAQTVCTAGATGGEVKWGIASVPLVFDASNPTPHTFLEDGVGITITTGDFTVGAAGLPLTFPIANVGGSPTAMALAQDPPLEGQYLRQTIDFNKPVTGLKPAINDVDADLALPSLYRDVVFVQAFLAGVPVEAVQINHGSATGIAIAPSAALAETSCQAAGNNAALQASVLNVCLFGIGDSSPNTATLGNNQLVFASPVDQLVITYVAGDADDGVLDDDPGQLFVAVGDMCWDDAPVLANIKVEKTLDTAGPYLTGQTVSYTVTVTNNGPDAASNVVINDLPNNLNITSVASTNCSAFPCTIATMANGAVETITVTGVVQ